MHDDNVLDAEEVPLVEMPNLPAVVEASNREGMELPNRQDALFDANPERRCVAHKKNGEQCRKFAIRGSTVCRTHGGATRHILNAARVRIQNNADKLSQKEIEFVFDETIPPHVRLNAAQDLLDRAGLKAPTTVEIGPIQKPWETVFDSIGGTPGAESSSVPTGYLPAGLGADVEDVGVFSPTPQPDAANQTRPDDQAGPRNAGMAHPPAAEDHQASGDQAPPPQGKPRERDRDRRDQPPSRHVTGEAAMQAANWANRAMAESHGLPWGGSDRRRR